jgi:hypothetical protein
MASSDVSLPISAFVFDKQRASRTMVIETRLPRLALGLILAVFGDPSLRYRKE